MDLEQICPFGRYIRYFKTNSNSSFNRVVPLDCRLFFVKNGIGKIEVDGETLLLSTGSVLFINSFVPYTLLPSEARYWIINFDFTGKFSSLSSSIAPVLEDESKKSAPIEQIKFPEAPCFDRFVLCNDCLSLYDVFESAEREFAEKAPLFRLKNTHQITDIIIEIFRKNEFQKNCSSKFNAKAIADYIEDHLIENLSNHRLAEIFHFHPNYLSSSFLKYYGQPIHSYVLERRIIKSINYLEEGRGSVAEIAAKVGFNNNNYFSRYFKKIVGVSPKTYLRQKK